VGGHGASRARWARRGSHRGPGCIRPRAGATQAGPHKKRPRRPRTLRPFRPSFEDSCSRPQLPCAEPTPCPVPTLPQVLQPRARPARVCVAAGVPGRRLAARPRRGDLGSGRRQRHGRVHPPKAGARRADAPGRGAQVGHPGAGNLGEKPCRGSVLRGGARCGCHRCARANSAGRVNTWETPAPSTTQRARHPPCRHPSRPPQPPPPRPAVATQGCHRRR
jgi:hypothetical protein